MSFSPGFGMMLPTAALRSPPASPPFQLASTLADPAPHDLRPRVPGVRPPRQGLSAMISGIEGDEALAVFLDHTFAAHTHVAESVRRGTVAYALENAERAAAVISANVREEVIRRQDALLGEVEAVGALEKEVATVADGVASLSDTTAKLIHALSSPYNPMKSAVTRLKNLHETCEVLRKVSTFRHCVRALRDADMLGGPIRSPSSGPTAAETLVQASDAVHALEELTRNGDLSMFERIELTRRDVPLVRKVGDVVKRRVSECLVDALRRISKADVSAALQAFHRLGCLEERLTAELARLLASVQSAIAAGFDPRFNPNAPAVKGERKRDIWEKMEDLSEVVAICSSQVLLLQIALETKQDPDTYRPLVDFIPKQKHSSLSQSFLAMVATTLSDQVTSLVRSANRRAGASSAFNVLSSDFPRLRSRFLALGDRIVSSGLTLTGTTTDGEPPYSLDTVETILTGGLAALEETFYSKSLSRMSDRVANLFAANTQTPGEAEALGLAKFFATELSFARDDSVLSSKTAMNVCSSLSSFASDAEAKAAAVQARMTQGNAEENQAAINDLCKLHNALHSLSSATGRLANSDEVEWSSDACDHMFAVCATMSALSEVILEPLFSQMFLSLETTLLRIHEEALDEATDEGISLYVSDLGKQLSRFRRDIVARLLRSPALMSYTNELGRRVLDFMVRQVSLLPEFNGAIQARLIADMSAVERSVSSLCSVQDVKGSFDASRSLSRLLTMSTREIVVAVQDEDGEESSEWAGVVGALKTSLIAQHLLSRGPPSLLHPHRRLGLSVSEYNEWTESAAEGEVCERIVESLESFAQSVAASGEEVPEASVAATALLPAAPVRCGASAGGS